MGPQSLLYLPVDLMRNAPMESEPRPNAEPGERRYAVPLLLVVVGLQLTAALFWWALGP